MSEGGLLSVDGKLFKGGLRVTPWRVESRSRSVGIARMYPKSFPNGEKDGRNGQVKIVEGLDVSSIGQSPKGSRGKV